MNIAKHLATKEPGISLRNWVKPKQSEYWTTTCATVTLLCFTMCSTLTATVQQRLHRLLLTIRQRVLFLQPMHPKYRHNQQKQAKKGIIINRMFQVIWHDADVSVLNSLHPLTLMCLSCCAHSTSLTTGNKQHWSALSLSTLSVPWHF